MSAFSKSGLERMRRVMTGHIERGGLPGIVTLVGRGDEVHVDALGAKAMGGRESMRRDTIFRITSMSKPITAAAAMILVEECVLRLDEPLDRLVPELANRRVLTRLEAPVDDTVPATRALTLRDLLTFRLGFGQVMAPPDALPILRAAAALGVPTLGPPVVDLPHTPDEWIRRFATLPLMHQPGEKWMYNTGSEVLSVLVARAANKPLETFLRERIFEPLGMRDTSFSVPAPKRDRLASCYQRDPQTGALQLKDSAENSVWSSPPTFPNGAGGLVSTIDDFHAFGQMMANRGMHGRTRILSRASIDVMTTDQLTPSQKSDAGLFLGSRGWGFGVGVDKLRDDVASSPGRYGWDGGFGTSWTSDPKEGLVGIVMTQRTWDSPKAPDVCADFWTTAYAALDG